MSHLSIQKFGSATLDSGHPRCPELLTHPLANHQLAGMALSRARSRGIASFDRK